jgi:hypothetical protein
MRWADEATHTLDIITAAIRSPRHQTVREPASFPEKDHTDAAAPPAATQVPTENKSRELSLTGAEFQYEDSSRKVRISVEDPYHADNDSDHDGGISVSGAKKRKRSHSDVSNTEIPTTPAKAASVGKSRGKTTSTGSRSTAKASRFSKNGSKKRDQQSFQSLTKRNTFPTKTTSRSPSVTSTVLSDSSFLTQPSPTHPPLTSSEPRPFLHAHSRRNRGKAPTTIQEQLQKQRLPSLTSASASLIGTLRAEDVLTKAPSAPSAKSSPLVTRSHCRYHKISIPKTENGPRIYFLVPGCSLNDEDLINEEEIEDHGEAILQGDTRIVDDIETLDFEAYLHWVMRQLVGPDILRENEVFYLPEPNEEIVRNPHRPEKRKGGRPEKKRSKLAEEATVDSPQNFSTGQSPSQGSPIDSSVSVMQNLLGSDNEDLSAITETEDDKSSLSKTDSKLEQTENVGTQVNGPSTKGEKGSVSSRRRSRRLGQEAAAYQPSAESDEASSTNLSDDMVRKGPRSRGQKRLRTSDPNMTDGLDGRKLKKPKTRPNHSQLQAQPSQSQRSTQFDPNLPYVQANASSPPNELEGSLNVV